MPAASSTTCCTVPYTPAALERVAGHVDRVQTALGRTILLENPSTYLAFAESAMPETEFIAEDRPAHGLRPAARRQQRLRELH